MEENNGFSRLNYSQFKYNYIYAKYTATERLEFKREKEIEGGRKQRDCNM